MKLVPVSWKLNGQRNREFQRGMETDERRRDSEDERLELKEQLHQNSILKR